MLSLSKSKPWRKKKCTHAVRVKSSTEEHKSAITNHISCRESEIFYWGTHECHHKSHLTIMWLTGARLKLWTMNRIVSQDGLRSRFGFGSRPRLWTEMRRSISCLTYMTLFVAAPSGNKQWQYSDKVQCVLNKTSNSLICVWLCKNNKA